MRLVLLSRRRSVHFVPAFLAGELIGSTPAKKPRALGGGVVFGKPKKEGAAAEARDDFLADHGQRAARLIALPAMDMADRPAAEALRGAVILPFELVARVGWPAVEGEAALALHAIDLAEFV